jgi:Glycosyl transferases group 1
VRIVYIARHDQRRSNDDEGAIAHALGRLGHDVVKLGEQPARGRYGWPEADLYLFHHWSDHDAIAQLPGPKVFWYFDLVDWPQDKTLERRNKSRRDWMARMIPLVDWGFCTDGDWVANDSSGKLSWLPQGADGRIAGSLGIGKPSSPITFFGIRGGGGMARESWVDELHLRWSGRFRHVPFGVHGQALKEEISRSSIVLAPDSPVTNRYWSNRVWLMLGFGAFLIHPYSRGLEYYYKDDNEIIYYATRDQMSGLIEYWLSPEQDDMRRRIAEAGLKRTLAENLYQHRCEAMLAELKLRGIVK